MPFLNNFREMSHRYPTRLSQINFVEGNILLYQAKFTVSSQGLRLWNRLFGQEQKNMAFINGFKNSVKISLLCLELLILLIYLTLTVIKNTVSVHR